jgi:hypothetical protein
MVEVGIPMLSNENKAHLPKSTLWIHVSIDLGYGHDQYIVDPYLHDLKKKRSHKQYTMELCHGNIIATNHYKADLCDSKSTNMMTILESIQYSNYPYRNLGR